MTSGVQSWEDYLPSAHDKETIIMGNKTTPGDAIIQAAKDCAATMDRISTQVEYVTNTERELRQAECKLHNMQAEFTKLHAVLIDLLGGAK